MPINYINKSFREKTGKDCQVKLGNGKKKKEKFLPFSFIKFGYQKAGIYLLPLIMFVQCNVKTVSYSTFCFLCVSTFKKSTFSKKAKKCLLEIDFLISRNTFEKLMSIALDLFYEIFDSMSCHYSFRKYYGTQQIYRTQNQRIFLF